MISSTFGKSLKITTFGESHGNALGVVIDGILPGLDIDEKAIQKELDRRRPGQSKVTTSRKEKDKAEILSGVFEGKTTGHPICIIIRNKDMKPKDYSKLKSVFRPGHADYTFLKKYGIRDYRGGGRSSGRETVARVAAGAIAKEILKQHRIRIRGFTRQVGNIRAKDTEYAQIEKNTVRCPDKQAAKRMEKAILSAKKEGDSLGGVVEIVADNMPVGLGDPVFEKLDARIGKAMLSIGAIKGVEIGSGFRSVTMKGSRSNDVFQNIKGKIVTKTNNSGGIQGGISNGMPLVVRVAVKPPSSISKQQKSVDDKGDKVELEVKGRHDPCLCPRVVPVAESMLALVLADSLLIQKDIQGKKPVKTLRNKIDLLDATLLDTLAERYELSRQIGRVKAAKGRKVEDKKREEQILRKRKSQAKKLGLDEKHVEQLFKKILAGSRKVQR